MDGTSVDGTLTNAWYPPVANRVYPACVFPQARPEEPGEWKSCGACGQSGTYIDYGGPTLGPVAVECKVCRGKGWLIKDKK